MISKIVSDNIVTLMERESLGVNALGRKLPGLVSPATITKFTATPDEANPKISTIQHLSEALKVSPWMLLIEDFPFEVLKNRKLLNKVSADGYALLSLYEAATAEKRKEILNYVSYQLKDTPGVERKIQDTKDRYLASYPISSTTPYPGCDEDHGK